MPFSYLQDCYEGQPQPAQAPIFQVPEYLYDLPPTLATGGGAEAFHVGTNGAQWFQNNGFDIPAVADAYSLLESFQQHFPAPVSASPLPLDDPGPLTVAGLPVYSQSGFDVIALLARVQARPNPQIHLGPVDFTTSFVVVDVRRHDDPIVYCSPSFCTLTGYSERDVLGRNCRFLQAPSGASPLPLAKGDRRKHTSATAVHTMAKAITSRKEAQVSVVNYRKDGNAFVNLVSVVPLFGEHEDDPHGDVVWYVGFQIDLTVQSETIVSRVREGRYYASAVIHAPQGKSKTIEPAPTPAPAPRERRSTAVPPPRTSPALARLLAAPAFLTSFGLHPTLSCVPGAGLPPDPTSHALNVLLLSELPDFVHVLSLKGAFLYCAPAVTRVLGWSPADLVGRALSDVCFAHDVVSVGRALKEASLPPDGADTARTIDLVFRARTKSGRWVWVECRGRLHVEPGKGRKAIVLIGRARAPARLARVAPVEEPLKSSSSSLGWAMGAPSLKRARTVPRDEESAARPTGFWGVLDPHGLLLSVGAGAHAVLGWDPAALRSTRLGALVVPDLRLSAALAPNAVDAALTSYRAHANAHPPGRGVRCRLRGAAGPVDALVRLLPPAPPPPAEAALPLPPAVSPARLMYHVRRADAGDPPLTPARGGEDVFAGLDPARGSSWQYELQQLRIANARLEEEIVELERAERERGGREMEMQRYETARALPAYLPPPAPMPYGYEQSQQPLPQDWTYPAYQLPMKRAWHYLDDA
ncbi:hypothetical protein B0H10DRAFT_2053520 [Mycena sp. CBHHK59/15]|nr:hypothetical protein B0H10DRAFT_2053520 [Mycena sp. CBHHK59/15]